MDVNGAKTRGHSAGQRRVIQAEGRECTRGCVIQGPERHSIRPLYKTEYRLQSYICLKIIMKPQMERKRAHD